MAHTMALTTRFSLSQVLAHLASVPRLTAKLQCSLFRRQAAGLMKDATAALQCVQAACTQVSVRHQQQQAESPAVHRVRWYAGK